MLIGLVLYALLRRWSATCSTGLRRGAGRGPRRRRAAWGTGRSAVLWRVELPLALPGDHGRRCGWPRSRPSRWSPSASIVGYGGLGHLILDGFQNNFYRAEIITGDGALRRRSRWSSTWS